MKIEEEREMLLSSLQEEVEQLKAAFRKVADTVVNVEQISNYPIFIAHRSDGIGLGVELFDRKAAGYLWSYRISTLEELVQKAVLGQDKLDDFRLLYKSKKDQHCILMLHEQFSQWVFVPAIG